MVSLINRKGKLCLIGFSLLFFTGSTFAQIFDGDDETKSWVIDLWSPSNENASTSVDENPLTSWDIGSALDIEEPTPKPPEPTIASGGSSGGGRGGRLGTANYSLRNRSTLVTMERQAMIAKTKESENKMYASAPKKEKLNPPLESVASIFDTENDLDISDHILIANQIPLQNDAEKIPTDPVEIIDHLLIASAGRDDLVTAYKEPTKQISRTQPQQGTSSFQSVRSSAPKQTDRSRKFQSSLTESLLMKSEPFPIHQTHLMSWNGMDEDIAEYKVHVLQKIVLDILVITGKGLFYLSILGILIFLLFREKLTLFHRNKVRQLTLFSLLK